MAGNMADKAFIGGRWVWAGGPYSGMPVDSTPANAGDLTPYLRNPQTPDPTGRVPQWTQPQTRSASSQVPTWAQGTQPVAQPYFIGTAGQARPGAQYPNISPSNGTPDSSALPRNPWQDVLEGKPAQNFNPGGAFGVGKETLPSIQRWNRLAPSEQQGYTGYLQDHLGVNSQDVYGLMQKLKPAGAMTNAPRWSF